MQRRTNGLRRYPALGFLVAAAVLASLLPSALNVPLSGPSASAELAPVPGHSDSSNGDLSSLDAATTEGLGSGLGSGPGVGGTGGRPDNPPPSPTDGGGPSGSGSNPVAKRCVARRQSEDPLSPSCVAFFKGDNFGATSKGVTKDEVRVMFLNCNADGSVITDVDDRSTWGSMDYSNLKAYADYFNTRYQTYDRRVHFYVTEPAPAREGRCNTVEQDVALIQELNAKLPPFIIYDPYGGGQSGEAVRTGTMVNLDGAISRRSMDRSSPYVIMVSPDVEDHAANIVEALCVRLAGRPARFAVDPSMRATKRKFGIFYSKAADPENYMAHLVIDGVNRRCPQTAGDIYIGYLNNPSEDNDTAETDAITRMRLAGVTTVIVNSSITVFAQAEAQHYYPEWLQMNSDAGHNSAQAGVPATVSARGFMALISRRRLGLPSEQFHRMALNEGGCEGTTCSNAANEERYNQLLLLFTGIQGAGPKLSPANFDRGIRSLTARQSRDPFSPSAYFSPGNHTFFKDFSFGRWDSSGLPPGGSRPGCWRLVEDGLRYRAEDWVNHPGDDDTEDPNQVCQGD